MSVALDRPRGPDPRAVAAAGRACRVSLVCATLGRDEELARLLGSLCAQRMPIELVVVDQNADERVARVLARPWPGLRIVHLRCAPGLSRARNAGLRAVSGEIVGFPDDDCWYAPGTLARVLAHFDARPEAALLTGRFVDASGRGEAKWPRRARVVDRFEVWRCAISFTVFARARVFDAVPGFDETLGVGAGTRFGSGEETDFLLHCLRAGLRVDYDPALVLRHPIKDETDDAAAAARARSYAIGAGRVLRRHGYPLWFVAASAAVPAAGAAIAWARGARARARLRWGIAAGRIEGWRAE